MIAQIDLDGGGTVSFDEFVQVQGGAASHTTVTAHITQQIQGDTYPWFV
jgi:hypothetical protein